MTDEGKIDRGRRFLLAGAPALLVAATPTLALAHKVAAKPRRLKLHNLHTGDTVDTVYHADGRYLREPLAELDWVLRDWRTDETAAMDRRLLDLLHALHREMDTTRPFEIISGYRSPATNGMLVKRGRGVAKKSLHMKAMAADISLPGRDIGDLYRAARRLRLGGAGIYRKSGFIHVDTGRVRYW